MKSNRPSSHYQLRFTPLLSLNEGTQTRIGHRTDFYPEPTASVCFVERERPKQPYPVKSTFCHRTKANQSVIEPIPTFHFSRFPVYNGSVEVILLRKRTHSCHLRALLSSNKGYLQGFCCLNKTTTTNTNRISSAFCRPHLRASLPRMGALK